MASSHLKRKVAPKTWPILRKTTAFITRPKPKGQKIAFTLPVVVVLRDILGAVATADQARKVLRTMNVTVNGTRVYDTDSAVGFMDILDIAGHKHRVTLNANNLLQLVPVHKGEDFTIEKVTGVTSIKGGKAQLNCASGRNVIVEVGKYRPGDSVQVSLDGKLGEHYSLANGAAILVIGGKHIGAIGKIGNLDGDVVTVEAEGAEFTTRKNNVYVVGKGKPAITLA
jgi:small subunit ribosomal protein S4e